MLCRGKSYINVFPTCDRMKGIFSPLFFNSIIFFKLRQHTLDKRLSHETKHHNETGYKIWITLVNSHLLRMFDAG